MIIRVCLILLILIGVTGCITLREAQSACEGRYYAFVDIVACTNQAFINDRRATENPNLRFYLMRGNQLAQMVRSGQLSDFDAKVAWQANYLDYRNQAAKDDQRTAAALNAAAALSAPTRAGSTTNFNNSFQSGVTCFFKSEWVSGFNKNCVYDCAGSQAVKTMNNTDLCPSTTTR